MKKPLKIALTIVIIVVAFPMLVFVAAFTWFTHADRSNCALVSSGRSREYLLYVPPSYDRTHPAPLVVSMHGAGLWPALQMKMSGWNQVAKKEGFLVVYPAGTNVLGNFHGPRAWPTGRDSVDVDVQFISDLIDRLSSEYNIDSNRVYVDGLSNGGGMAFAVSCRLANRVAAIGAVSAAESLPWAWCKDSVPIPMIAIHGTGDPIVPYNGGRSGDPVKQGTFPSVPEWTANWAQRNACGDKPIRTNVTKDVQRMAYTHCAANADVVLYSIEGGGHAWPGGGITLPRWLVGRTSMEINGSELLWDFYYQHPRASMQAGLH